MEVSRKTAPFILTALLLSLGCRDSQTVVEVSPEDLTSRLQVAEFYQRSGRIQDAADVYRQLLQLQPDQAVHWFHLGNIYVLLKEFDAAENAPMRRRP